MTAGTTMPPIAAAIGRAAWRGDAHRMGALHCFTGSLSFARALVDLGFYISFSGIVTFKNADPLREVALFVQWPRCRFFWNGAVHM